MTKQMQATIRGSVSWSGTGVHTGVHSHIRLLPAHAYQGIVFEVHDQDRVVRIPAHVNHVVPTALCTSLSSEGLTVHTVEHVLSAVYALGITNLIIEIHGSEIPMGDGSALGWTHMIKQVGIQSQNYPARGIQITQPVRVGGGGDAWCELRVHNGYKLNYHLHFDHAWLRDQNANVELDAQTFEQQVCWARTFGFRDQLKSLNEQKLALGAGLHNVLVFDKHGILNPEGMRSPQEPALHKILDAVGDLSLMGLRIQGEFVGHKSGHALNHRLIKTVINSPHCWTWI
jgi:UDP-3-O-[3-hydroxymyristoyl] N-acetylglucosamine deacetylase